MLPCSCSGGRPRDAKSLNMLPQLIQLVPNAFQQQPQPFSITLCHPQSCCQLLWCSENQTKEPHLPTQRRTSYLRKPTLTYARFTRMGEWRKGTDFSPYPSSSWEHPSVGHHTQSSNQWPWPPSLKLIAWYSELMVREIFSRILL